MFGFGFGKEKERQKRLEAEKRQAYLEGFNKYLIERFVLRTSEAANFQAALMQKQHEIQVAEVKLQQKQDEFEDSVFDAVDENPITTTVYTARVDGLPIDIEVRMRCLVMEGDADVRSRAVVLGDMIRITGTATGTEACKHIAREHIASLHPGKEVELCVI